MAQDFWSGAEDDQGTTRRVRRCCNKQECRRPMARGLLPRGVRSMAVEVVFVTTPRGTKWVAAPDFRPGPPSQLASWTNAGWDWGSASDVPILQSRIRELLERDINLVSIIQLMLIRRMLPCKVRPLRMWEFNVEGPWTILHFFGLTLEGMCKLFFGPQVKCPDTTEDAGLSCNHPDTQVSNPKAEHFIIKSFLRSRSLTRTG